MPLMPVAVSYFTGGALCLTAAFQAGGSVLSYSKSSISTPKIAGVQRVEEEVFSEAKAEGFVNFLDEFAWADRAPNSDLLSVFPFVHA